MDAYNSFALFLFHSHLADLCFPICYIRYVWICVRVKFTYAHMHVRLFVRLYVCVRWWCFVYVCCVAKRGYLICLALTNNSRHMHTECNGRILLFVAYFVFLFWVLVFFIISALSVCEYTARESFTDRSVCFRIKVCFYFFFLSSVCISFYDRRSFFIVFFFVIVVLLQHIGCCYYYSCCVMWSYCARQCVRFDEKENFISITFCEFHSIAQNQYTNCAIKCFVCLMCDKKRWQKYTHTWRNEFCIWIGLNLIWLLMCLLVTKLRFVCRCHCDLFPKKNSTKRNETKMKNCVWEFGHYCVYTFEWKAICSTLKEKRKGREKLKNIWINTVRVCLFGIKVEKKMKRTKTIQLHGWIQFDVIIIMI